MTCMALKKRFTSSFITNKSHLLFSHRLFGLKKFILVFVAKMVDGVKIYLSARSRQNSLKSTTETKESMTKQEMTLIRNKRRCETFLLSHTRHICLENN